MMEDGSAHELTIFESMQCSHIDYEETCKNNERAVWETVHF